MWRGIFEARRWLLDGCCWQVGSGESIKIWGDIWVLGHKLLQHEIDGHIRGHLAIQGNETVETLINHNTRTWDISKLRTLFNPMVADYILKIRLSSSISMDKCIWTGEANGQFSVESAII
ncbi:hypothetical protein I3760_12G002400 [Carya illinoinensis]|nr:hypothetical protein I3760_12G002400 [Carya illinoinensis]